MIWSEDDRDKLSVRSLEIVGKVCASVQPLEILGSCGVAFSQDTFDYIFAGIVPRVSSCVRIVQVAAGGDYFTSVVGLDDDSAADLIFTTGVTIVHYRTEIHAEHARIVAANGLCVGISRFVVPVASIPEIVMVTEHKAS